MATNLSNVLRKYYKRVGNEVVFRNGMILTHMALEMWARLGFGKVDASVLSRVVKGTRLFSPKQLEIFCQLVELSTNEQWEAEAALAKDYLVKKDLDIDLSISPDYVELAQMHLEEIYNVRIGGSPIDAARMAGRLDAQLEAAAQKKSHYRKILLRMRAQVLFQQQWAYKEIIPPEELWPHINIVADKLQLIAEKCDDSEIAGLRDYTLGDTYYMFEDYLEGIKLLERASERITNIDYQLCVQRHLALCWAYRKDGKRSRDTAQKARGLIEDGRFSHLEHVCHTLEGLGRSEGLLGLEKGWDTLGEADLICSQLRLEKKKVPPLRFIQVLRSKLETVANVAPSDRAAVEVAAQAWLDEAWRIGHERHARKILGFLEKRSNPVRHARTTS